MWAARESAALGIYAASANPKCEEVSYAPSG